MKQKVPLKLNTSVWMFTFSSKQVTYLAEHDAERKDVDSLVVASPWGGHKTKLACWFLEEEKKPWRLTPFVQRHTCSCAPYRGSSPEPSSRGFPPRCTFSFGRASSGRPVCPASASPRAYRQSWAEPGRSLPPPQCCPKIIRHEKNKPLLLLHSQHAQIKKKKLKHFW